MAVISGKYREGANDGVSRRKSRIRFQPWPMYWVPDDGRDKITRRWVAPGPVPAGRPCTARLLLRQDFQSGPMPARPGTGGSAGCRTALVFRAPTKSRPGAAAFAVMPTDTDEQEFESPTSATVGHHRGSGTGADGQVLHASRRSQRCKADVLETDVSEAAGDADTCIENDSPAASDLRHRNLVDADENCQPLHHDRLLLYALAAKSGFLHSA